MIIDHFGSEVNGLTHSIKQFLGVISFLDMGVSQVVRSSLYGPIADHDNLNISRIMVSGRKFYKKIAYALLGYVAILFIIYPVLVNNSFETAYIVALIAVMSISSFVQYYFGVMNEQLLHADQKSYLIYSVQIICTVMNLLVCIIMIRLNCSIQIVMLTTAVIFLIKPTFYALYIRNHYMLDRNVRYREEPIKQKWSGIAQHISAVVLDGTDNIVLTLFSTLSNVSIYSVYYMIVGSIQNFYQTAVVGVQSGAGAIWAKDDFKSIRKMFLKIEYLLHTVTIFLFVCTGILIVPFVQVYTKGLMDADYIQPIFAIIIVVAYGVRCLRTPYNIWILAAGHFKQTKHCHIIAAVLNLIISITVVSKCGLIGVAVGTLIAMIYQTTWMAIYTTRKLVKVSIMHLVKRCLADACMVIVTILATAWIRLEDVSYLGWFLMAVKVASIAAVSVIGLSVVFYYKDSIKLFRGIIRKEN